jgi:hypothetical protein
MLLFVHICIALVTVVSSAALLLTKKGTLQTATVFSTAGTLLSGAALVVLQNASLLHVCLSGVLLTGFACASVVLARITNN